MSSNFTAPRMDTFLGIAMNGSLMTHATYSHRESVGVSLLIATSCLSLTAVLALLLLMGVAAWANRSSESKNYFFRSNVAAYFVCLLLADLIQAIASIMNARWIKLGGVEQGQFCTTQAVLKQVSDVGAAIWSLVVSVQTFCLLFYQLHSPRWLGWVVLVLANGLIVMFTFLGPAVYETKAKGDFYGISGYWCWITAEYDMAWMTVDYLVLFLSPSLSFTLYTLVFFRLRGNIVVTGWHVRFRMLDKDDSGWRGRQHVNSHALSIAKQMILHPVAYTILFLPIAVLRLCEWTNHPVSFPVMMLCDSIFLLAGVVDVMLFCTIRRVIPVKEVTKALFTGQIFRTREDSPTDLTWLIGSLETGERGVSDDPPIPTNDDCFILRQPKFEIVTPPLAVLPCRAMMPTPSRRTTRISLGVDAEIIGHGDSRSLAYEAMGSIPRKPSPEGPHICSEGGEGCCSSISHQNSIRELSSVPRDPPTAALPPAVRKRGTPPLHHQTTTHDKQPSVRPISTRNRSESLSSAASDTSSMSGSTLLGLPDNDGSKDGGASNHQ